jgi:hypothetical protein
VVAHLQDVDPGDLAARQQGRLDRCLGVAGQQGTEPTVPQEEHDRSVVDVSLGKGGGRIGG